MTPGAPVLERLFQTLSPWLADWPGPAAQVPDAEQLAAWVRDAGLRSGSGLPLELVPPAADGLAYEDRIWRTGRVETRPDNWHDYFNGLVWLAFPQAKAALNARHRAQFQPGARGSARDAMTHLDECGILVLSSRPELLELLRGFQWRRLFWEARQEVLASMEFHVFGHATYEQLLAPFRGLTAKAVLRLVPPAWQRQSLAARRADLDAWLAAQVAAGHYQTPGELQPLPLLGIPGLVAENDDPAYYADAWQFRPGRRRAGNLLPGV